MEVVCDVLEELLSEGVLAGYAIGGATAAGFHGEPLATRDIDVFVFLEPPSGSLRVSLEPLFARSAQMGFVDFDEEGVLIHDFPVQFLAASPGLESEAVSEAFVAEYGGHVVRVMTPEHLAAIALRVGRPKDRARLVYLFSLEGFERPSFESIVLRYGLSKEWEAWSAALGLG